MRDVDEHIRAKLSDRIEKVRRKLEDLPSEVDLTERIAEVMSALAQIGDDLQVGASAADPDTRRDYAGDQEARRERLMAQLERLKLRQELLAERRNQLQEVLDELQESLTRREPAVPVMRTPQPQPDSRRLQEDRRRILEMVQAGTITADEAARLLDALRNQPQTSEWQRRKPRWVRIRVTDTVNNRIRLNLTLPVGVVRAGLRAGGGLVGVDALDAGELEEMLNRGEMGHILDAHGQNDNERVEIFIE